MQSALHHVIIPLIPSVNGARQRALQYLELGDRPGYLDANRNCSCKTAAVGYPAQGAAASQLDRVSNCCPLLTIDPLSGRLKGGRPYGHRPAGLPRCLAPHGPSPGGPGQYQDFWLISCGRRRRVRLGAKGHHGGPNGCLIRPPGTPNLDRGHMIVPPLAADGPTVRLARRRAGIKLISMPWLRVGTRLETGPSSLLELIGLQGALA